MDIEQAMNIQPDSALVESVESLKAALGSQTTLIYVLIAIAALSLIIAIAAMRRGRGRGEYSKAPAAAAAYPAPAATASVSNDGAIAAAITAAIACILTQEKDSQAKGDQGSGFIVRRIRRV